MDTFYRVYLHLLRDIFIHCGIYFSRIYDLNVCVYVNQFIMSLVEQHVQFAVAPI